MCTVYAWRRYRGAAWISWQCDWGAFLEKHKNSESIRPGAGANRALLLTLIADSAKVQREIGNLNIALIIDATGSMGDAIEDVKDKIDKELLSELGVR